MPEINVSAYVSLPHFINRHLPVSLRLNGLFAGRHTSAETGTVVIPEIPQDIVDEILDHLAFGSDFRSLQACALVSKL